VNKDPITTDSFAHVSLVVFAGPREKYSVAEFEIIKDYLASGGSVLFMLGEGGENKYNTNVNFLLEEYGISFNNDSVARTVYYKYLHPKEVLVTDGILNKGFSFSKSSKAVVKDKRKKSTSSTTSTSEDKSAMTFVYPYGGTLNVQKPAVALLSSGHISYPLNRPIAAVAQVKGSATWDHKEGGRIGVLGSVEMFSDEWLNKEQNDKVLELLVKWLFCEGGIVLDHADAEDPDVDEYHHIPHTEALAERLRSCLQEGESLPRDFTQLFDDSLFKFDVNLIPKAVELYETLGVKHEPLTLIPPQFDAPLPPLVPAVFPPSMREPPPPALDQFDLDEHFASERLRLAQLTNKCTDEDLEFYVRESADILGVLNDMNIDVTQLKGESGAKQVLEFVLRQVVRFKKLNQEGTEENNARISNVQHESEQSRVFKNQYFPMEEKAEGI